MERILTGSHRLLKNLNSNVILNLVRTNAPISGAGLAKITGMRSSTVQNILKTLEKKGMVLKIGTGNSTQLGGRRPTLWNICGNYGYVLGIQLELNEIRAVLVDLNSQIITEKSNRINRFNSLFDIEKKVVEITDDILDAKRIDKHRLLGVGIGVSGLVDISDGVIIKTSLFSPSQPPIHLEKSLKKYFEVPIYIENDANAAALAEKWFGKAKEANHFIFTLLVIDRDVFGIGYGLILDNAIYRGAKMFAGETTSFALSIKKILKKYCNYHNNLILNGQSIPIEEIEINHLLQALDLKNEMAIQFFQEVGKIVGTGLVPALFLLDPKMIVIGGEATKAKDFLLDPIRQIIQNECSLGVERQFSVVESSLSNYAVALGAASIILQKIFQEPLIKTIGLGEG